MKKYIISKIIARQVLDSRGNPTIEVDAYSCCGCLGRAIVPSGASTGEKEALELRDNDKSKFMGLGVEKAIKNVNTIIAPEIIKNNFKCYEQVKIDNFMIKLDGTKFKSKLGANAILGVSVAIAKLGAKMLNQSLYRYLGGVNAKTMPVPMMNILNGGAHADNALDFQEFMIIPFGAKNFSQALQMGTEIYHHLKKILKEKKYSTLVGDEGGFAPNVKSTDEALECIVTAIKKAGYKPSKSEKNGGVGIGLDVAASEFYNKKTKKYEFKKHNAKWDTNKNYNSEEMINYLINLCKKFPIISIEDPFDENDWESFSKLTQKIGEKIQIVGDDIFVTNKEFVKKGIEKRTANSVLIKINQIGTITETIDTIELAKKNNWTTVVSHRSGETEDTTIADLVVALNCGQIKTGSLARTDRIAKYNQLLRINECLGNSAVFNNINTFYNINRNKK